MTTIVSGANGVDKVAAGAIEKSDLPAGSVLQVVQTSSQPNTATTSSSWSDTGLSVTITPTSASSKILVLVTHVMQVDGGNSYAGFQLLRNSSAVCDFMDSSLGFNFSSPAYQIFTGVNYIDSPATTSATTYKTQFRKTGGSGTIYLGLNSPVHSITAMEISV